MPDHLIPLIPAAMVIFLVLGLYKSFFEKKVQAKEHIQGLLSNTAVKGTAAKEQENILKRRKKLNKDGQMSQADKLEIQLERGNMLITPKEFYLISAGVGVVLGLLFWFIFGRNIVLGILLGGGSCFLPTLFLMLKVMVRMQKAAAQFSDVLDNMMNAFKTGFGFSRAVQIIADNYDDPWGTEFGKMAAEMNLGASMEDALYSMSTRVPSPDVDLFVTALLIQKDTGGSMAELLGNLSKTIRDRYKLFQKVGAISAQGKLSASIVSCIPFLLCGIMFLFLPTAMIGFFTNPIGILLACLAGFWMVCGICVLYKIVQIEV